MNDFEAEGFFQMTETMTLYDCTLQVDPCDGNDLIEADAKFPIVPRMGDHIELWDKDSPYASSGFSSFAEVIAVSLCAYAPERIVVQVRFDGFDLDEVRRVMEGVRQGDQP